MQDQYVTLNKNDKLFSSYISGSFSKTLRALPTQNLNVNTPKEEVTFQVIPVEEIQRPSLLVLLFRLFRFEWLSLTWGPLLACYSYLYNNHIAIRHIDALMALVAVTFFHSAVFALNDYKDHVNGVDRISASGGSQVIKKGWLTAESVRRLGVLLFVVGAVLGTFLILKQPFFLIAVGGFVGLSVLGYSFFGQGLKTLGFGEFITFFCFGPLMTYGFSRAASHQHSLRILALGVGFGFLSSMCLEARQLENIMADSMLNIRTLAVRLGFDRTKKLLQLQLILLPILFCLTIWYVVESFLPMLLVVPLVYFSWRIFVGLIRSRSSLSSKLSDLRLQMLDLHIIFSTLITVSFWLIKS